MSKRKAVFCTLMFSVIVLEIFSLTYFIKNDYGFRLFDVISPVFCGMWTGEQIKKFYIWLRR